jgi:FkbM family methyltransferase
LEVSAVSLWSIRALRKTRSAARKVGLTRLIGRFFGTGAYEQKFSSSMLSNVRKGDCIWDVGANVGHYATQFCELTGPTGTVVAFEPSPDNQGLLNKATADYQNLVVVPFALGQREESVALQQGMDSTGATSKIVSNNQVPGAGAKSHQVKVLTAEQVVAEGKAKTPNFIKIDTEGYELDVLKGMGQMLAAAGLRVLCIEVHFRLLEERGQEDAPALIDEILCSNGFDVNWVDASHIVAFRGDKSD